MPKYLSARRLGINTTEHRAMVTLVDLIAGVPNTRVNVHRRTVDNPPPGTLFSMQYPALSSWCGTVACLGGHVALVMAGVDLTEEFPRVSQEARICALEYVYDFQHPHQRSETVLAQLYFPRRQSHWAATAVQAGFALRHYLTTGEVDWPRAFAEAPPPPGPAYGDPDHPYDPE